MSINLYDVNGNLISDYQSYIYYIDIDRYRPLGVQSCILQNLKIGKARGCTLKITTHPANPLVRSISIPGFCVGNKDYQFHNLFNIPHGSYPSNQLKVEDKSIDFDKNEFIRQWRDLLQNYGTGTDTLIISNIRFELNYCVYPTIVAPYARTLNNRDTFLMKEFGLIHINELLEL